MPIPEEQLETWTGQGAITTAKLTADSIKNAIDSHKYWPNEITYETYLQGSYKNDTNIRGDSDVDVVAQLTSSFSSNLTEDQKRILGLTPASYGWSNFRKDVLAALVTYYGQAQISERNKAINIKANGGRLPGDVVVCTLYRRYRTVSANDFIEGMCFWTIDGNNQIINYPKIHYDNGVSKHQICNSLYKATVRMFKNCRGSMANDNTPSYFVECLLYNVPNAHFVASRTETFINIVNWLNQAKHDDFICQNGQTKLFGTSQGQWSLVAAQTFINNLVSLWKGW